jgi:adenylate cyclase
VVEGTLAAFSAKVRLTARLIDASTARSIRIETFELDRNSLKEMRDDVSARVASFLNIELVNAQAARSFKDRPNDPEGVDLLIRARALWARAPKGRGVSEPRNLFRQAAERNRHCWAHGWGWP